MSDFNHAETDTNTLGIFDDDEWSDLARAEGIRCNLQEDRSGDRPESCDSGYEDRPDPEMDATYRLVSQIAAAVPRWWAEVEQEELDTKNGCRQPTSEDYEMLDRLPALGGAGVRQLLRVLLDLLISSDSIVRSLLGVSDRPLLSRTTGVPSTWRQSRHDRRRSLAMVFVNPNAPLGSGAPSPKSSTPGSGADCLDVFEVDLGPHSASKELRAPSTEGHDDLVFTVHVVWRTTDPQEVVRCELSSIWAVVEKELRRFVSRTQPRTSRPQFISGLQSRLNSESVWNAYGLEAAVHVLNVESGDRGPVNQVAFEELKHTETEFLRRFIADSVQNSRCMEGRTKTPLISAGLSDAEAYLTCEVLLGEKNMTNVAPFVEPQDSACGGGA
jgi:hypothetical protein